MHLVLFGLNRRQSETLLLVVGQLVLLAFVFQVLAIDHWHHTDITDVTGVVDTSGHEVSHADHCHGALASCAEAVDGFAQVSAYQIVRLPRANPSLVLETDSGMTLPEDAFIAVTPKPPRAAA
jgi:hypothetical protein